MALLASAILSTAYCELVERGVIQYFAGLLVALDVLVILWIIVGWADAVARKRYGRRRDVAIIAIFPVFIWPLYAVDGKWTSDAIDLAISAQMLLSFPARTLWAEVRRHWRGLAEDDTGTLRLALA